MAGHRNEFGECVAGVHAPAFVERRLPLPSPSLAQAVSPGFTPPPSLSEPGPAARRRHRLQGVAGVHAPAFVERRNPSRTRGRPARVAGVHAPAFVERRSGCRVSQTSGGVSPGFTPRPSLSGRGCEGDLQRHWGVSPGFTPRPSLSVDAVPGRRRHVVCVAGVHAPAFVERAATRATSRCRKGVAGVHAPAFVERSGRSSIRMGGAGVAGVHAPAFVERR